VWQDAGPDTACSSSATTACRGLDGHVHLNQWLLDNGYLVLDRPVDGSTPLGKRRGLVADPGRARGYGGQVHLNLRGRDPAGA